VSIPNSTSSKLKRRSVWVIGAAALAALSSLTWRRPAEPARLVPLRIALPQVPHAGLLHIAAGREYFKAHGLGVTLLPQIHGKAALAELLAGRADVAAAADVPIVVEVLKGAPLGIATTLANAPDEMAVVARRDRGIHSSTDLQGRRVGVTFGTSGDYFLWAYMVRHRLAAQSLTLVDLPPNQLIEALGDGSVDAIAAWQPVRHGAESALGDAAASFAAPDAYAQTFNLVGSSDFLRSHGDVVHRVVLALLDAERYVRAEPLQAKRLLAARLGIEPYALDPAWQSISLELGQRQAQLVTLEDVSSWAMTRGYAPVQPVPNFLSHIYLDALMAATPERVTVVR